VSCPRTKPQPASPMGMNALDQRGDGKVDLDEWHAGVHGISPAKADALFKKLDTTMETAF
jgi:hypothetical protein